MTYVFGALAGLAWGALAAFINMLVSKKCMQKTNSYAMLGANAARMLVDLAALATVFLLRNVLPFRFEAAIIGTAVAMSILTIVFAFRLSRPDR